MQLANSSSGWYFQIADSGSGISVMYLAKLSGLCYVCCMQQTDLEPSESPFFIIHLCEVEDKVYEQYFADNDLLCGCCFFVLCFCFFSPFIALSHRIKMLCETNPMLWSLL